MQGAKIVEELWFNDLEEPVMSLLASVPGFGFAASAYYALKGNSTAAKQLALGYL